MDSDGDHKSRFGEIETTIEVEGYSIYLEYKSDHHGDFAKVEVTDKETGKCSKKTMNTFPIREIKAKKSFKKLVKDALRDLR